MNVCGCITRWLLSGVFVILYAHGWFWSRQLLTTVKYDNMESAGKAFEVLESSDHCHFRHTIGDSIQTSKGICPMVNASSRVVTFDMRKARKEGSKKTRRSDMDAYGCPCVQRIITSVDKLQDVSGQLFLQFPEYVHCHVSSETPNTTSYIGCVASDSLRPPLAIMETIARGRRFPSDPVKLPTHIQSGSSLTTNLTTTVKASPLLGYGVITKETEGSDVGGDSSHSIPSIFFNLVFYMRCWKAPMEEKELYRAVYYSRLHLLNMVGIPSKMKRSEYFLEVTNLAYTNRAAHPVSSGMYCSMEYYITTTNHWNFLIILSLMTAIIPIFLNLLIHDDFFTWSCIMSAAGRTYQEQSRRGRGGLCEALTCTRADLVGNVISCVYISSNMVMNILSLVIMQTLPHHGSFGVQWHRYCTLIMIHITFFVLTTLAWLLFQWKLYIDKKKEFWFKKMGPAVIGATDVGLTCLGDPVGYLKSGSASELDFRPARKWLNLRKAFPCVWALCYRVWMENRKHGIRDWLYDTSEFEEEWGGSSSDENEGVETPASDVLVYDTMDATEKGEFDLETIEREDAYTDSVGGVRMVRFLGRDIIVPKESTKVE